MSHRLQIGIDFSQKRADFCLLFPDGWFVEPHVAVDNSLPGYGLAKRLLLDALDRFEFDGVDVSGEATGYYWLPFFLQLAADPDLEPHDLKLHVLNPRWVYWFKKCFAQDDKSDQKDAYYIVCASTPVSVSTSCRTWQGKSATCRPFSSCAPAPIAASSPSLTSSA